MAALIHDAYKVLIIIVFNPLLYYIEYYAANVAQFFGTKVMNTWVAGSAGMVIATLLTGFQHGLVEVEAVINESNSMA